MKFTTAGKNMCWFTKLKNPDNKIDWQRHQCIDRKRFSKKIKNELQFYRRYLCVKAF